MISYDLAKQLKENGFPGISLCRENCEPRGLDVGNCYNCHYPTLSELIEACGDNLISLRRVLKEGWNEPQSFQWYWFASDDPAREEKFCGTTSDEAVANLWLAINQKP